MKYWQFHLAQSIVKQGLSLCLGALLSLSVSWLRDDSVLKDVLCFYKMAVCDSWSHILSSHVHWERVRVFVLFFLSKSLSCVLGALLGHKLIGEQITLSWDMKCAHGLGFSPLFGP